jgi:hypothetical protein
MVSWIPNNGGTTRQVRDKFMFTPPYGFFFWDWVKLLHATTTTKKKCKKVFISDHKSNELKK